MRTLTKWMSQVLWIIPLKGQRPNEQRAIPASSSGAALESYEVEFEIAESIFPTASSRAQVALRTTVADAKVELLNANTNPGDDR
jgi:hypothetical protein